MLGRRRFVKTILTILWVTAQSSVTATLANDKDAEKQGGKVAGILIDKTNDFLTVKADGDDEPIKYLVGDGSNKTLADALKGIFNASRVQLTFKQVGDERQLLSIRKQILKATGTVTGAVVKVYNDFWVEVKPKKGLADAYAPGATNYNDKNFMAKLRGLKPGDIVTIKFTTDFERHRIVTLRTTPPTAKAQHDEDRTPLASATDVVGTTTLSQPKLRFTKADKPYAVLRGGDFEAVVVDNSAVDDDVLPGHKAGYSGLASIKHSRRPENLFVPSYAGLNFENIFDGTKQDQSVLFEPRIAPMELRMIDEHTVELYQPPTPHFGLESCLRYALLPDGAIELTVECVPRRDTFHNGYIGLFWASYIHQPESLDIHFLGHAEGTPGGRTWVRGVTPSHGVLPTHLAADDKRTLQHDDDFPLKLVFNRSRWRYDEPWYYGVSHSLAYVQMFRPADQVRLSQSPSGGGEGNPAWDFQWFVPDYKVGKLYRFVMRAMCLPFESAEQIERETAGHRTSLAMTR